MKSNSFWLLANQFIHSGSHENHVPVEMICPMEQVKVLPRADWFPNLLLEIKIGNFTLFEIVSGPEKNLGPNQLRLKRWINHQSYKNETLKVPFLIKGDSEISKEDLAEKIMEHIENGSEDMAFLPSLPIRSHFTKQKKVVIGRFSQKSVLPICFP